MPDISPPIQLPDAAARLTALLHHDRTLLVEAGAGSGKTALMAGRVALLIAAGIPPREIVAITFTEAAASELLERIERFVEALRAGELPPEVRKLATSLKIEAGAEISRVELAAQIIRELDRDYARICAGKFAEVADEWEAGCATIGRNVTVQMGDRKICGCAESLDDDGALLVRTEHGHLERVIGGDVTLEK